MTETSGSSPPPTAAEVAAVAEAIAAAQALAAAGDAPSTSGGSGAAAAAAEDVRVGEERKDDCGPKFDALWCCYSPRFQLAQYYIYGRVDNCHARWGELMDCLKKKTSVYKEEVVAAEAEAQAHPLWEIRTHAEAAEAWRKEFGHLSGEVPADAADGGHHTAGKPTLV